VNKVLSGPLHSERLLLRKLESGDVAALCGYRSEEAVARYQGWDSFGPDDAERLIAEQRGREPGIPGTWLQLAIIEKATGDMAGDCGLHCRQDDPQQMEIGITVAPSHQKRGYAAEAVGCLLEFVFGTLDIHRVEATTDAENLPCISLFRRLGFRQEAHFVEHLWFKGNWGSEIVFAMLQREWEGRVKPVGRDRCRADSSPA